MPGGSSAGASRRQQQRLLDGEPQHASRPTRIRGRYASVELSFLICLGGAFLQDGAVQKAPPKPAPPVRSIAIPRDVRRAIDDGLAWLTRHQDERGCWSGITIAKACKPEHPCQPETALDPGLYSNQADVGVTALALLAFLRAGNGDEAKPENVQKGLHWLVEQQQPDGSFSAAGRFFLYNEAIATLALSEAFGLTQSDQWKVPAQKAVAFLCHAQKPNPTKADRKWGWSYFPGPPRDADDRPDMSVTGWMVMALYSAKRAGLEVPAESIEGALDFTRWCTSQNGLVGYYNPEQAGDPILGPHDNFVYHVGTMSSIGFCVRLFLEADRKDPFLLESAENVLLKDLPNQGTDPDSPTIDYYYWYYGALALNQLDGRSVIGHSNKYWGPWSRAMNKAILALQDQTKDACSYGGWMVPDRWSHGFGPAYTTAINVLSLEVGYR